MPRRRTPPSELVLVPVGAVDDVLLRELGEALRERLDVQWRIGAPLPLHEGGTDAETGMCCSLNVLQSLPPRTETGGRGWMLAIAESPLCADGVGEVLGEAEVGGCRAVVGLAPLRRGSGADGGVLAARLLTEALHELGHLAGAEHCGRASCVMFPSLRMADTDRKGHGFCADCARVVEKRGIRKS
jgi:archaemetzincin